MKIESEFLSKKQKSKPMSEVIECKEERVKRKAREKAQRWREKNREKVKQMSAAYRARLGIALRERQKQDRLKDVDAARERDRKYYRTHKRKKCEAKARSRKANPENEKMIRKTCYEKNRARFLSEKKELYKKQSEIICAKMRLYAKQNRSKINERETLRRHRNPNVKLRHSIGGRIRYAIKEQRGTKASRTMELTGCSIAFLRAHIESQFKPGMTWENHGTDGWHIDHIKPCASFNLLDPEEQRKCFHWTNMQPLWAAENMSKGAR